MASDSHHTLNPRQEALVRMLKGGPAGLAMEQIEERYRTDLYTPKSNASGDAYRKKIQADMNALRDFGIAIEVIPGWPKHYRIDPSYRLPGELTLVTALSVVLARTVLESTFPSSLADDMDAYFERAREFLNRQGSRRYAELLQKIAFYPEGYGSRLHKLGKVPAKVYHTLLEALLQGRQVRFSYLNRYQNPDSAHVPTVHPHGIVLRNQVAYLVARPVGGKRLRHYNLLRISAAPQPIAILEERAEVAMDFNLEAYLAQGAFLTDDYATRTEEIVTLRVTNDVRFLLEERLGDKGLRIIEEEGDGASHIATFKECLYPEFDWWLLGFGDQVEVLEPTWLRSKLQGITRRMAARYAE